MAATAPNDQVDDAQLSPGAAGVADGLSSAPTEGRLTDPTLEQMREHVARLVEEHQITVTWCDRPGRARAIHDFEEIRIAPVKSAISYAVALHEIGHIRGRFQRSRSVMVRERHAWKWAKANALTWTDAMERVLRESLEWYRENAPGDFEAVNSAPYRDAAPPPARSGGSDDALQRPGQGAVAPIAAATDPVAPVPSEEPTALAANVTALPPGPDADLLALRQEVEHATGGQDRASAGPEARRRAAAVATHMSLLVATTLAGLRAKATVYDFHACRRAAHPVVMRGLADSIVRDLLGPEMIRQSIASVATLPDLAAASRPHVDADARLIELGQKLEAAAELERREWETPSSLEAPERAAEAGERIVKTMLELRATSLRGLAAKARAVGWCAHTQPGRLPEPDAHDGSTETRLLISMVDDVLRAAEAAGEVAPADGARHGFTPESVRLGTASDEAFAALLAKYKQAAAAVEATKRDGAAGDERIDALIDRQADACAALLAHPAEDLQTVLVQIMTAAHEAFGPSPLVDRVLAFERLLKRALAGEGADLPLPWSFRAEAPELGFRLRRLLERFHLADLAHRASVLREDVSAAMLRSLRAKVESGAARVPDLLAAAEASSGAATAAARADVARFCDVLRQIRAHPPASLPELMAKVRVAVRADFDPETCVDIVRDIEALARNDGDFAAADAVARGAIGDRDDAAVAATCAGHEARPPRAGPAAAPPPLSAVA